MGIFKPVGGSSFAGLSTFGHRVPGSWAAGGAEEVLAS